MQSTPANPRTDLLPQRTRWREGLLLLGFLLVLAASVVTVLLPELGKSPESESEGAAKPAAAPKAK